MEGNILLDPTTRSDRHQDFDGVYHIYNRIAHSVRFLNEEEKNDLLDRMRRVSEFCGIRLLSWCLMTNHFHLLVFLPNPQPLSVEEIQRRLTLLRPDERAVFYDGFVLNRAPREITKRMFNIGMMMKIIKENFTIAYNGRTGHHGTMWEGPYRFKKVPMREADMSRVAAYQNLNPVSACMTCDYTSYPWTSFAAASKGDAVALAGLDFIFGGYANRTNLSNTLVRPADELLELMRDKMDHDLEGYKRERAEMVWRKRIAAGSAQIHDPLTNEAMVEQIEVQMARLGSEEFREELGKLLGRVAREAEVRVVRSMAADPEAKSSDLAKVVGVSESCIKRISLLLQKCGVVSREGSKRRSCWRLHVPPVCGA